MTGAADCCLAGGIEYFVTRVAVCFWAGVAECFWAGDTEYLVGSSLVALLSVAIPIFLMFFLTFANGAMQSP